LNMASSYAQNPIPWGLWCKVYNWAILPTRRLSRRVTDERKQAELKGA